MGNRTYFWLSGLALASLVLLLGLNAADRGAASPQTIRSDSFNLALHNVPETAMVDLALRGVHFVPNHGQWDNSVLYGFNSRGMDIAFRESSLTMHLIRQEESAEPEADIEALTLSVSFPGSNAVNPQGVDAKDARFNYYIGDDESAWATDVPSFGAIVYEDIYDGIDLHVTGAPDGGVLKYEFHCAPGSDHTQIKVRYDGIDALRIDEHSGELLIETPFGTLRDGAPLAWQEDHPVIPAQAGIQSALDAQETHWMHAFAGMTADEASLTTASIPTRYALLDSHTYTFAIESALDPNRVLVIDPDVEWMYYLGGSETEEAFAVVVDGAGNALLTGYTASGDFIGRNNKYRSEQDAFLLKVAPSGQLLWMAYLGGTGEEWGLGLAVDAARNAFVTGYTESTDFAQRVNAHYGLSDAFVLKVSPSGALEWMTYLGGSSWETGFDIALDSAGNLLVGGKTFSDDFVARNNSRHGNAWDAFVLKVDPTGGPLWMTYLGGSRVDQGYGIVVDNAGSALLVGTTQSTDFEGRTNSFFGGTGDAFALKVSGAGQLQWMIHLGGSGNESANGAALDGAGNLLIAGWTDSADFAGRNNSYYGGVWDAFALKVNPSAQIQWMTYLGGTNDDWGYGIAVDSGGNALVTGSTLSTNFAGANNTFHGGTQDAFALKVSPSGQIPGMTYLGGSGTDAGNGIAVDSAGDAVVAGRTGSLNFAGRINSYYGGSGDAFIVKLRATATAFPHSYSLHRGNYFSGNLASLFYSDDDRLNIRPGVTLSSSESPVTFTVEGDAPVGSWSQVQVVVESNSSTVNIRERIEAFNFTTGLWDMINEAPLTTVDNVKVITLPTSSYLGPKGELKTRLKCRQSAPVLSFPWTVRYDNVVWRLVP